MKKMQILVFIVAIVATVLYVCNYTQEETKQAPMTISTPEAIAFDSGW